MNRGDNYHALVTVLKAKNGVPTVISVKGLVYTLQARDGYKGNTSTPKDIRR